MLLLSGNINTRNSLKEGCKSQCQPLSHAFPAFHFLCLELAEMLISSWSNIDISFLCFVIYRCYKFCVLYGLNVKCVPILRPAG